MHIKITSSGLKVKGSGALFGPDQNGVPEEVTYKSIHSTMRMDTM
jgi:hypothetical protein